MTAYLFFLLDGREMLLYYTVIPFETVVGIKVQGGCRIMSIRRRDRIDQWPTFYIM